MDVIVCKENPQDIQKYYKIYVHITRNIPYFTKNMLAVLLIYFQVAIFEVWGVTNIN